MKRVALHTLGCKLNFAETSTIGRQFVQRGYQIVDIDAPADVCVINTCSVTERADRECRQIVRRALRHSPNAYVIVTGCYAQLQPEEIASIAGVDLVLGSKEKFDVFGFTNGFNKAHVTRIEVSPIAEVDNFGIASSVGSPDRTRAFLKVQDGCDFSCAFCTIPLARGGSRSLSVENTVSQAMEVIKEGYKEIVLTGVNVGDYGKKIGASLYNLLKELERINGLERIRISSIEPNLLTDELLDFWLGSTMICKHFHIPLQAGTDELLRSMRRRYQTDWYANRVQKIKASCPSAGIGVDVIVGFPGETDDHFKETYKLLVDLPVSYLHVFTYSERPNTPAASFENQVEPRVRFERSEQLRILSAKKRRQFYESAIGSTVNVLFESQVEGGWMTGLSDEYIRVNVPTLRNLTNEIAQVSIIQVDNDGCVGKLVNEQDLPLPTLQATQQQEALCML
ncbi:MAG: tRNA (N(6)-L-threonylcarbamoyladenosine(37)-C(2))-methylthiotransferase MtaB [Ignavibacteriales bacterium]|nr:tRNA (N(6)-L-threonylcarbamoyladenosine(37)-C(2))-methylthiotransferase MtaB [Ignavibacteriales bacterium]